MQMFCTNLKTGVRDDLSMGLLVNEVLVEDRSRLVAVVASASTSKKRPGRRPRSTPVWQLAAGGLLHLGARGVAADQVSRVDREHLAVLGLILGATVCRDLKRFYYNQ